MANSEPQWLPWLPNSLAVGVLVFLGGVIGAYLLYRSTVAVARKSLLVGTVTNERAQWRHDLRLAVGELVEATHMALHNPSPAQFALFEKRRVAVKLRLNPSRNGRHLLDMHIMDGLHDLREAVRRRESTRASVATVAIEKSVQQLLKQEWDKSRREAQTGELEA